MYVVCFLRNGTRKILKRRYRSISEFLKDYAGSNYRVVGKMIYVVIQKR